ncbi:MAG: hypothetical protein WB626_10360 [Bacteroidota bacterium]
MAETPGNWEAQGGKPALHHAGAQRKTILICSPDPGLRSGLAMLFQDRYDVLSSETPSLLNPAGETHPADLLILDEVPTEALLGAIDHMKAQRGLVPVILLYVCSPRNCVLDRTARDHVDAVFYKPPDVDDVARRVEELLVERV